METKRLLRLNELLKEEIGYILLREIGFDDALVTITRVSCSTNGIEASVFVAVIPDEKMDSVFATLRHEVYSIQQMINRKLRMRPIPKIKFIKEKNAKEAEKVEGILAELKKEEK
ncbi:MAG: 30S ribosome-binding factor RbfA [Candidatus Nealsonbacteria bacterium]|nr:30S ribosome-binding factor RbfA [Candidatus Nealsonbacteria bacterium]